MQELADREGPDTRRLVLGFDAGCMACSGLASRIQEQAGEKVEVRSLSDPQVEEWRRRALGENAPWAPTLVEVKDGSEVKAWTGLRMGIALSRRLGPATTWKVMQILGERGFEDRLKEHVTGVRAVSRGQFLRGAVGGLAALSILPASQAVSFATEKGKGSTTPIAKAVKAVRGIFRIRSLDGKLSSNPDPTAAINHSTTDDQVKSLQKRMKSDGLQVNKPKAQRLEILSTKSNKKFTLDLVTYPLSKGGKNVGAVYHEWGYKGTSIFSLVHNSDGTHRARYFEDGRLREADFDRNGHQTGHKNNTAQSTSSAQAVQAQYFSCEGACQAVCSGSFAGKLATCLEDCLVQPEAEEFCAPLCTLFFQGLCFIGCDNICDLL